ncbi:DUF1659 domain-containing protein [Natranaerobius trueperi]|uniref:DUF1659 domain-containing protein n=1 Tax=Natranaerobius trueperi TaxID=759412 RepID=UPI0013033C88|nr:DUF1659 domain-containing protein [Natranaerobius trueperi]
MFGPTRLQFRLITGQDENGNAILRTKSFSRIDEDIYQTAELMLGLQKYDALSIHRFDGKELAIVKTSPYQ